MHNISSNTSFGVVDIAFSTRPGVANDDRAASSLARLANLKVAPGYKDISTTDAASAEISLNTNGFLLAVAMEANDTAISNVSP